MQGTGRDSSSGWPKPPRASGTCCAKWCAAGAYQSRTWRRPDLAQRTHRISEEGERSYHQVADNVEMKRRGEQARQEKACYDSELDIWSLRVHARHPSLNISNQAASTAALRAYATAVMVVDRSQIRSSIWTMIMAWGSSNKNSNEGSERNVALSSDIGSTIDTMWGGLSQADMRVGGGSEHSDWRLSDAVDYLSFRKACLRKRPNSRWIACASICYLP